MTRKTSMEDGKGKEKVGGNSKVMAWRMETWSVRGRNQETEEEGCQGGTGWRDGPGKDASAEEGPAQPGPFS